MIRYWDASAIVPLLVAEGRTSHIRKLLDDRAGIVTWWGSVVECASAIARMERDDAIEAQQVERAFLRLSELRQSWVEVEAIEPLREQGIRLLRLHHLRAADALQLAAAILASRYRPTGLEFVCLDQRLVTAARREGFQVILS